jgi:hypothetical protein
MRCKEALKVDLVAPAGDLLLDCILPELDVAYVFTVVFLKMIRVGEMMSREDDVIEL